MGDSRLQFATERPSYLYLWMVVSFGSVSFVLNLLLTSAHLRRWKADRQKALEKKTSKPNHTSAKRTRSKSRSAWSDRLSELIAEYGTITSIIFYTIFPLMFTLIRIIDLAQFKRTSQSKNGEWCWIILLMVPVITMIAKSSMYSVFVARVHLAFRDSKYQYHPWLIDGLYCLLLIYTLVVILVIDIEILRVKMKDRPYNSQGRRVGWTKGNRVCVFRFGNRMASAYVIIDIVLTAVLLALFIRPLRLLDQEMTRLGRDSIADNNKSSIISRHQRSADIVNDDGLKNDGIHNNHSAHISAGHSGSATSLSPTTPDTPMTPTVVYTPGTKAVKSCELRLLPFKYLAGCTVAVFSTFVAFSTMAASVTFITSLDSSVNILCLVLLTPQWKTEFWRLFAPLFELARRIGLFGENSMEDIRVVQHYYQTRSE